ncbi:hypothetical protein HY970_03100 [Candidatus Kaiserbacteria bacterium]|nr:hypothetical protein [Candidatus Kaiserbacteria bacterium]
MSKKRPTSSAATHATSLPHLITKEVLERLPRASQFIVDESGGVVGIAPTATPLEIQPPKPG